MLRTIAIFITTLLLHGFNAYSQVDTCKIADLSELLEHKYYNGSYNIAKDILQTCDSLPEETIYLCAVSYYHSQHYDECIVLCDSCIRTKPYTSVINDLTRLAGNSYYHMKEYELSKEYYRQCIEYNKNNGLKDDQNMLIMYAYAEFNTYNWQQAESIFKTIIETKLNNDNLTIENIHYSTDRDWYGDIIHDYALSCLFQAKEDMGIELLKISSKCGNVTARQQYSILTSNSFYVNDIKIKAKHKSSFEKYLRKYDIQYPDSLEKSYDFWEYIINNNKNIVDLKQRAQEKRISKPLQNAFDQIANGRADLTSVLSEYTIYKQGDLETDLSQHLFSGRNYWEEIRIYRSSIRNAFATPYGQIYISSSLVQLYDCNPLLLAICAHEATHYLCYHSLVHIWEYEKRKRNNEILSAVTIGLNAALQISASIYAASSGVQYSSSQRNTMNNNLINLSYMIDYAFEKNSYYFQFKYSREQELEADLIAYRYCEIMGIGGYAYILALELLGDDFGSLKAEKQSDHPTIAYRVAFLKYIYEKERTSKGELK